MTVLTKAKIPAVTAAAVLGVALIAAGCGSSSTGSSSATTSAAAASASSTASGASTASNAAATGASIKTASGSAGTYLTDAAGRALYLWVADSNGKSSCSGACASIWPPLTSKAAPTGSGGVKASALGTITRSDGAKQVTYNGHPLYYFASDTSAGTTKGQGSNTFGAKWWLVTPAGKAITSGGSSTPAPAGSSTSSSGGGWG
jgi:predicted lipoprotein with Yx(FWY)xxD motif